MSTDIDQASSAIVNQQLHEDDHSEVERGADRDDSGDDYDWLQNEKDGDELLLRSSSLSGLATIIVSSSTFLLGIVVSGTLNFLSNPPSIRIDILLVVLSLFATGMICGGVIMAIEFLCRNALAQANQRMEAVFEYCRPSPFSPSPGERIEMLHQRKAFLVRWHYRVGMGVFHMGWCVQYVGVLLLVGGVLCSSPLFSTYQSVCVTGSFVFLGAAIVCVCVILLIWCCVEKRSLKAATYEAQRVDQSSLPTSQRDDSTSSKAE